MGTKLFLLSVAAMLLMAVNGCPIGKEFITAFMANNKAGQAFSSLQLAITAQRTQANVKVVVQSIQFSTTVRVEKWSTSLINLPPNTEMRDIGASTKTVQITSDSEISVVAFNNKFASGDSSIVFPITELGTEYVVFTPNTGPAKMDKLVAIINGKEANEVEISPFASMQVKGFNFWQRGVKVTIRLAPYEVYQCRSLSTFSGSRIKANRPVAVLAGHQCSSREGFCTHVYEQLAPLQGLSTQYLVPVIHQSEDMTYVVVTEDNTNVNISTGKRVETRNLNAGQVWDTCLKGESALVISTDKRVMVMYYSSGSPYGAFFTSVIPLSAMANEWSLDTQAKFESHAVIISEADGIKSTRIGDIKISEETTWSPFANPKFVWARVPLGLHQRHIYITSNSLMAVYIYGGKKFNGYGTIGVCNKGFIPPPPPDPCSNVKCREKEECQKGVCVHISKATCRAVGDPHYSTFDGRLFDFQGTCTYTMATTLDNDAGLTPFKILTKNDHRGNNWVAFVRTVTVTVYSQTVVISKQRGMVEVNGMNSYLPISLAGGKLRVIHSGRFAVLTTDFGLEVKYDWNMELYITAPSSYFRSLGGLCGNYNGDRLDEFTDPKGTKVSTVLEFATSWKTKDGDLFCHDDCRGICPSCSATLQEEYKREAFCGLMAKKEGPFANCHGILDPNIYVDNCVYDVCINKGYRKFLCNNMESYAGACQAEGVKLDSNWRTLANCPMDCPENSHYESCGTGCPASCGDPDAPNQCKRACVEGCQCNKGFALSGDKCVAVQNCGCTYEGQYYLPGKEFWADQQCSQHCKCDPKTAKVECVKVKCKQSQVCDLRGGVRDCYPTSFATCQGAGDPHYRTFDGKTFDFQGTCTYYLSKLVNTADSALVPFEVRVQNQNRGRNTAVSYTKTVEITVYGNTIILSKESPGKVLFNNQYVNLPFQLEGGTVSIFRSGYFGVVKTDFGLKLQFNWDSHVDLTLPSTYSGAVGGLCGNWNGKNEDDMMTPEKSPAKTPTIFGNSWKVRDDPGCSSDCSGNKCPTCDADQMVWYQKREFCGTITDSNGPFKSCHSKVDPKQYFDNCVYDMCLYRGHATSLCSALSTYTTACQNALAPVSVWRSDSFCPPSCKPNSHYEVCATGCPQTCSGLSESPGCEGSPCAEGCVCDEGFMLSDGDCVPLSECGCVHAEQYYKMGQIFFPQGLCNQRCVCQVGGVVQCDTAYKCGPNEKCQVRNGVQACHPDGIGTCSVFGASQYHSFDGKTISLRGDCVYKMAEVIQADGMRPPFTVSVHQESFSGGVVATRSVEIQAYEYKVAIFPRGSWKVMVNNIQMNLPLTMKEGKVNAYQNGFNIIVETEFGLKVTYDSLSGVIVEVPATYKGAVGGLCGNYNGNNTDDFMLPSGIQAPSVEKFAEGWVVFQEGVKCQTGCGTQCPTEEKQKNPKAEKACSILTLKDGPLSKCHTAIPPQEHFNECVQEVIKGTEEENIQCQHIQKYVALCQAAGIPVGSWRTETFCTLKCPVNSHYELCSDTCSSTCASLSVSTKCPRCQEGCQCDDGFVFDGDVCVPLENCGCMVAGRYYKSGESVRQKDCTEICSCKAGVFTCKAMTCTKDEFCRVKDGTMRCSNTDPCKETTCREKENCVVKDNKALCVAQSKANCWAMGDPHYQTFDGSPFSFQGTCSYTLTKTTGKDGSLTAFSIMNKNEIRGNSDGSFVRSASIKVKGHEISIRRDERRKVRIDGILSNLPLSLESGSIKISESGVKGIMDTDFGLQVVFDWSTLFMVTVTSSYYDNLAGICGTYNANQGDDFTTPKGEVAANITEWARSWSVPDGDPFCWHYCKGHCPTCSEQDQSLYRSTEYCGLIQDSDGPFSQCHNTVAPEDFVSDCLYDVCLNEGRQEVYCDALNSYVLTCQKSMGSVSPLWRMNSSCPLSCPENSHYESCGNPCPATCAEPNGPNDCRRPCTESCQCNEGFVLSGDKCVSVKQGCGCMHEDRYYMPDESFWADSKCQSKCSCDRATQKVVCKQRGCKLSEVCRVVDGIQDCYPVGFKTCTAQGDPHFQSFDGKRFDFQGNCVYKLAGVCSKDPSLSSFEITLENNNRGSRRVSFAKVVTVIVLGSTFTMSQDYPGKILVNDILTSMPYNLNNSAVQIYRSGRLAVLDAHFGLQVTYDWSSSVRVKVPSTYQEAMCGLCGNYNNNPDDDLRLPNGTVAKSPTEFGNSYLVGDAPGCSQVCKDCAPPVLPPGETPPPYIHDCDVIIDKNGPLRDCIGKVNAANYHENCVYDILLNQGQQKVACDVIAAYVEDCQGVEGKIEAWRKQDFCVFRCPANSMYSINAPGCPATCSSMSSPAGCKAGYREGCVCNPGFLLSDDQCLSIKDCGCLFEGRYYISGSLFYPDGNCLRRCACTSGTVACEETACSPQETCKVNNGIQGCYPKGLARCIVSGDSQYLTFDQRNYDFRGPCEYTLAQGSNKTNPKGLEWFSISMDMEPDEAIVLLGSISIEVFGFLLTFERDSPWVIKVDSVISNLPVSLGEGKLKVFQAGKGIVLETNFGLRVTYDLQSTVSITVPSTYSGQVSGLCGNYNGRKDDDFQLPSNIQTDDVSVFGAAWQMDDDGQSCGNICPKGGCTKPDDKKKQELSEPQKCGLITNTNGPLATCHSVLPPAGFLESCIYNSITAGGNIESTCRGIEAYVSACQEAGVTLKAWRRDTFCPLTCPIHSHYALCADTCHTHCKNIISPGVCEKTCTEGCECDDGFVADGSKCVPIQNCGCNLDGMYLMRGESVYLRQCSQKCTCSSSQSLVCVNTTCDNQTVCGVTNGLLGCYPAESTCFLSGGSKVSAFDGSSTLLKDEGLLDFFSTNGKNSCKNYSLQVMAKIRACKQQTPSLEGVYAVFDDTLVKVSANQKVWINSWPVPLPWQRNDRRVSVTVVDGTLTIAYSRKVLVKLSAGGDLSVRASNSLLSQVKGLCGAYRDEAQRKRKSFRSSTKFLKNWAPKYRSRKCA